MVCFIVVKYLWMSDESEKQWKAEKNKTHELHWRVFHRWMGWLSSGERRRGGGWSRWVGAKGPHSRRLFGLSGRGTSHRCSGGSASLLKCASGRQPSVVLTLLSPIGVVVNNSKDFVFAGFSMMDNRFGLNIISEFWLYFLQIWFLISNSGMWYPRSFYWPFYFWIWSMHGLRTYSWFPDWL